MVEGYCSKASGAHRSNYRIGVAGSFDEMDLNTNLIVDLDHNGCRGESLASPHEGPYYSHRYRTNCLSQSEVLPEDLE